MADRVAQAVASIEAAEQRLRAEAVAAVKAGDAVADVARRAGVSRPTIYKWLRG